MNNHMHSTTYYNPYYDQSFFGFFWELLKRAYGYISGEFSLSDLAADEVQIIVLMAVAASGALVGTFLILRRMTMLANSLSHTILIGIVMVYLATKSALLADHTGGLNIQAMLIAAVFTGLATAFLTQFLTKTVKLQADASTGLVFTSLFALGIILVTALTRNAHIGTEVVMGNADALQWEDCKLVGIIFLINGAIFFLFFKEFALTTFDPSLAKALGFSTLFFDYLLMTQVSITSIGAFRAVGVLMVLSFMTGPPLTARLLVHDLKKLILLSMGIGCLAAATGVALSRHILTMYGIALSTAGICVCVIVFFYVAVIAFRYTKTLAYTKPNIKFLANQG